MKFSRVPIIALLGVTAVAALRIARTKIELKHADPTRPMSRPARLYAAFGTLRPVVFLERRLLFPIDPYLQRLTRGRVKVALTLPTTILETIGAKTGAVRQTVVMYFHDGDRVILLAVNSGAAKNPGWYHNLRANPEVTLAGVPMLAREIEDDTERQRLLSLSSGMHPWPKFSERAGEHARTVPIIELTPRLSGVA